MSNTGFIIANLKEQVKDIDRQISQLQSNKDHILAKIDEIRNDK